MISYMNRPEKFDTQVKRYERLRDNSIQFYEKRRDLLKNISGSVLEVSPGPGLNFDFYTDIKNLTTVDISPEMTKSAQKKWREVSDIPGKFITDNLEHVSFSENSFDSIVSTCSLCSYENPVLVLNKINSWCKPDGKIYLLEHGLSDNAFVRFFQYLYEPIHYKRHMCQCTRDIEDIVTKSHLKITSFKKLGSFRSINFLYEIQAQPKK